MICKSQWLYDCGMRYGSKTTLFCFFAYESFPPLARSFAIYDPKRFYYMNFLFVILVPDAEGKISTSEKFSIYFPLNTFESST